MWLKDKYWEVPTALPMGEWEIWDSEMKKKYPVKYFLFESVPDVFDDVYRFFKNIKYWVRHRTIDKYHIVDTGLKPDYYDADTRMLHAMMQLLVDYVDIEMDNVIWDDDNETYITIHKIYIWWKYDRPVREELFEGKHKPSDDIPLARIFSDDNPDAKAYNDYLKLSIEEEKKWWKEDEEMMVELIKIRGSLWS